MKIAIIGAGNIGGTLAKKLSKKSHTIYLGVRNQNDTKVKALLGKNVSAHTISDAVQKAPVVIVAVNPTATKKVAKQMGDVSKKIIIDTMNTFRGKPQPHSLTSEALLAWTNCKDVVRCFNSTGFENIQNPTYKGTKLDMFVAGNSKKGKQIATKLSKEIGFGNVYDLGGNEAFLLAEQIVIVWMGLSKRFGRNIALKMLKR